MSAEWVGRVIDQRYVVESVLGAGGMGLVLRAKHRFTGGTVAIKVLRSELSADPDIQHRFLAEAQAPNAIGHPGIVRVVDAGRDATGLLYLAMELLEGRSLRIPMARGELTPIEARRIMLELLDALAAAHVRGFVHRDLKPDNVFLVAPNSAAKLLDFGIAKVLDAGIARVRTATGITLGTPAYMAPEQLSDASSVDARADLWAAGVIVYEMLSGRLPFPGSTPDQLFVAIATKEPDPIRAHLPHAPPALETFFARALARDPRMRFGAAIEMAQALTALPLEQLRPTAAASGPQPMITPPASYAATPAPGGYSIAAHTPAPLAAYVPAQNTPAPSGYIPAPNTPGPSGYIHAPNTPAPAGYAPAPNTPAAAGYAPAPNTPAAAAYVPHAAPHTPPPATAEPVRATRAAAASKSRATLFVSLAAGAAVIVLVVLLVAPRSHDTNTAPSTPPAGSAAPTAGSAGSAAAAAVVETPKPTAPPTTTAPAAPVNDAPKSRMERIAAGDIFAADPKPAATPKQPRPTTTPGSPKPAAAPATPAAAVAAGPTCEESCKAAVRCGFPSATCVQDCANDPVGKVCLDTAVKNCNSFARCLFKAICNGAQPSGRGTCAEAFVCQSECTDGDISCGCRCAAQMAPAYSLVLLRLDLCVANCKYDESCAEQNCGGLARTCGGTASAGTP